MTQPWGPPVPPPPMSNLKKGLLGCGGAFVGFFVLLLVIGLIVGPQKHTPSATRPIVPAAAATSSSPSPTPPPASPSPSPTPTSSPKPSPKAVPKKAAAPSPTPSECDPGPDILVWSRVPTLPDSAEALGSRGGLTCSSTFTFIQDTSPTDPGYCTEAAWASDNPGYDVNASPARRLKDVQVMVGPACP